MKLKITVLLPLTLFLLGCPTSQSTYMKNRSLDQQVKDDEREKIVKEEQEKKNMEPSVNKTMEDFNKKALDKQPVEEKND